MSLVIVFVRCRCCCCCHRETKQEWEKHKKRHEVFESQPDEELQKAIDATLHSARVSYSEYFFVSAIESAAADVDSAKTVINGQIMAWSSVNIVVSDIHPKLWLMCQLISKGKVPE